MESPKTVTISYDEKPGIQAVKNIAPDFPLTQQHGTIGRDYEYKRLGTLSLLAGMDLLTGEIIPLVSDTYKRSDFITWLKKLDTKYPEKDTIRLILDNHSAHTSKETKKISCYEAREIRICIYTKTCFPAQSDRELIWEMTKQCLRGIRVNSKKELEESICWYITEVNKYPVVYHWTYKMDEVGE